MPSNTPDLSPIGGGNDGLTTEAHITSVGRLSLQTVGTAISPAVTFESDRSLGWYRSGVSTMALSYGSFLMNQARLVSVRTLAASAITAAGGNVQVTADEVGFVVGGASGATLYIKSNGTIYLFNSAASAIG